MIRLVAFIDHEGIAAGNIDFDDDDLEEDGSLPDRIEADGRVFELLELPYDTEVGVYQELPRPTEEDIKERLDIIDDMLEDCPEVRKKWRGFLAWGALRAYPEGEPDGDS